METIDLEIELRDTFLRHSGDSETYSNIEDELSAACASKAILVDRLQSNGRCFYFFEAQSGSEAQNCILPLLRQMVLSNSINAFELVRGSNGFAVERTRG